MHRGMLLMILLLFDCITATKACLQCDNSIRTLHEDFILSAPSLDDQIELANIRDHAYVTYTNISQQRMGVVDPTTLYRARTEYQSEFDRFLQTELTNSITFDAIQIMEKGGRILENHLDGFIPDGLCPNECGLLNRRVMDCVSCLYKTYTCPSPTGQEDCGEFAVEAEEGGQAVLDCFLSWHPLLLGGPEYHYSKLKDSEFEAIVVTDESSVVLNQLHVDEKGTYRCSLQDRNGTVFYQVIFLLNVTLPPHQTNRPPVSLPPLPLTPRNTSSQPLLALLVPVILMVTALALTLIVGLNVALRMMKSNLITAKEEEDGITDGLL